MTDSTKPGRRKTWNHHPRLPIPDTPVFDWPPRLPDAVKWMSNRWVNMSASILFMVVALLVFNLGLLPGDTATYGTADTPWGHWFGSFHDGTEAASDRIRQRVRERALKSKES